MSNERKESKDPTFLGLFEIAYGAYTEALERCMVEEAEANPNPNSNLRENVRNNTRHQARATQDTKKKLNRILLSYNAEQLTVCLTRQNQCLPSGKPPFAQRLYPILKPMIVECLETRLNLLNKTSPANDLKSPESSEHNKKQIASIILGAGALTVGLTIGLQSDVRDALSEAFTQHIPKTDLNVWQTILIGVGVITLGALAYYVKQKYDASVIDRSGHFEPSSC